MKVKQIVLSLVFMRSIRKYKKHIARFKDAIAIYEGALRAKKHLMDEVKRQGLTFVSNQEDNYQNDLIDRQKFVDALYIAEMLLAYYQGKIDRETIPEENHAPANYMVWDENLKIVD